MKGCTGSLGRCCAMKKRVGGEKYKAKCLHLSEMRLLGRQSSARARERAGVLSADLDRSKQRFCCGVAARGVMIGMCIYLVIVFVVEAGEREQRCVCAGGCVCSNKSRNGKEIT